MRSSSGGTAGIGAAYGALTRRPRARGRALRVARRPEHGFCAFPLAWRAAAHRIRDRRPAGVTVEERARRRVCPAVNERERGPAPETGRVRVLTVVAAMAVVLILLMTLLWGLQRRLIYLPDGAPAVTAASVGAIDVRMRTEDGLELTAWWFPAPAGSPQRGATVLVAPGNAGSRSARASLARGLNAAGLDVLVMDYRGYGGNPGSPDEEGLAADARAAHEHLVRVRGIDPRRLVLFGESLGAAVVIRLALERPAGALVLRSPFTALADIGARAYPFLPVRLLLRDRYPSLERIARVPVPMTVVAGTADEIVPFEQSRAIAEAARSEGRDAAARSPTAFVTVPGARHNDPALVAGPRVVAATVAAVP